MLKINLRHFYPDQYEKNFGVKLLPTKLTSVEANHQHWLKIHQHDLIEINAWDHSPHVPPNHMLVEATLGGKDETLHYFAVTYERYSKKHEFGYIIQPGDEPYKLAE